MLEIRCEVATAARKTASLTAAVLVLLSATAAAAPAGAVTPAPAVLALVAAAAAAVPAGAATPAPGGCAGATVVPANVAMRQAAADAILCLINVQRTTRGLPAVVNSSLLTKAATMHSGDMVRRKYFSHIAPGGQGLRARIARTGYLRGARQPALGETIAWGADYDGSPDELVKELMADAPHRAIIIDRRFRDVGVGLAFGAPLDGMGDGRHAVAELRPP